ncbi:hypothetical protein M8J77_008957 [Diaphorina citri]|nr:hypothetical protein M8J77_008957 [Diaphorina citri]
METVWLIIIELGIQGVDKKEAAILTRFCFARTHVELDRRVSHNKIVIMAKLTDEEVLQILSEGNTFDFEIDEPEGELDMFKDFYAGFAQQARRNEDDNMST